MPAELVQAHGALETITALVTEVRLTGERQYVAVFESQSADAIAQKAMIGEPVDVLALRMDWTAVHNHHETSAGVFRIANEALEIAQNQFHGLLFEFRERVVLALRAAFTEVIESARSIIPKLGGAQSSDQLVAEDQEEGREAWRALTALGQRQQVLLEAYGRFWNITYRDEDFSWRVRGIVAATGVSAVDLAWPMYHRSDEVPWPAGNPQKLIWLATLKPEPGPWLPLPADLRQAEFAEGQHRLDRQSGAQAHHALQAAAGVRR